MSDEGFAHLDDAERERCLNQAVSYLDPSNRKRLYDICRQWGMSVEEYCASLFDLDDMIRDELWHEKYGTGEREGMDLTGMIACHV